MKPQSLTAAAAIIVMTFSASTAAQQRPADAEWKPLFDGKSLTGFTQRGGKATYRVENGEIIGQTVQNTPNSFLCTDAHYADFELEYEFKVDPSLNSGVQIRSNSFPTFKDGVVHGYQVEIDPSERAFTAGIYDEARLGKWIQDLSENEPARKAFKQNEWNKIRVLAVGESLKTWLNGVPAADTKDAMTHSGFIGLQVHHTISEKPLEVRWRNLRIKDFGDPWQKPPAGATVLLGDKGDTSEWEHADKPGSKIEWLVSDTTPRYIEVKGGSGNIVTRKSFGDARIHVEFAVDENNKEGQANGNSGVYLQRRYELQILNSWKTPPAHDTCGGIYKVAPAAVNAARAPGEWQTYDIWFHAARFFDDGKKAADAHVTVYHNGTRIQDNLPIPDKTGGGQDEGPAPGPILLQDHGNKIRFRNVWAGPLQTQ